jgi:xylan 1,4-beta-xylosidase
MLTAARWRTRWQVVSRSLDRGSLILSTLPALIACALAGAVQQTPAAAAPATQAPTPQPQAPTPQPQAPTPQPQAPAPQPQAPAPQPQAPAPQPQTLTGFAKPTRTVSSAPVAYFDWFEYSGHDSVFNQPLPPGAFRNPILAGFHPDPSIVRVGDNFYLVNSTFTYFPGIPVFQSNDLVHWHVIGNVIDRPGELNFDGLGVSRGVFAPTIRYHNGVFYVVSTAVDAGGNFVSVATRPQGPWSDPIWLREVDGIDPSLFFDEDGKAYLLNNGPPPAPPQYDGHRAIWIQQFDPAARKLFGPRKVLLDGGVDIRKKPVWIEGPHLYRRGPWYFLLCAEGGTSTQHSEVVLRARSPWGPFQPFAGNPILTQRDLPPERANPIANAGHADLVEAGDGHWWAVFLASRPYETVHYNTGRETFVLPVTWHDGWPAILPRGTEIPYVVTGPVTANASALRPSGPHGLAAAADTDNSTAAATVTTAVPAATADTNAPAIAGDLVATGNFTWRDEFNSTILRPQWLYVRVPKQPWADLAQRPGWLTIHALRLPLDSLQNMSFLARRQQHLSFDATTELELPRTPGIAAGMAAFQSENYWYFLGVRRVPPRAGQPAQPFELILDKRGGKQTETVNRVALGDGSRIKLKISADAREYSFYFDEDGSGWKPLRERDDGSILSTDVAGGFVGAFVGPYARAE